MPRTTSTGSRFSEVASAESSNEPVVPAVGTVTSISSPELTHATSVPGEAVIASCGPSFAATMEKPLTEELERGAGVPLKVIFALANCGGAALRTWFVIHITMTVSKDLLARRDLSPLPSFRRAWASGLRHALRASTRPTLLPLAGVHPPCPMPDTRYPLLRVKHSLQEDLRGLPRGPGAECYIHLSCWSMLSARRYVLTWSATRSPRTSIFLMSACPMPAWAQNVR
jgi:hypothetical protein